VPHARSDTFRLSGSGAGDPRAHLGAFSTPGDLPQGQGENLRLWLGGHYILNDNLGQVIFLLEGWVLHGLSHRVCPDIPLGRGPLPIRCGAESAGKGRKRGARGSFTNLGPGLFALLSCKGCLGSFIIIILATTLF